MGAEVLVTGGTGRLGRLVAASLLDARATVRVLARHRRDVAPEVTFHVADLRSNVGVGPAVDGVAAIVHCATSTKGDADATRNLVAAARRSGEPHLVHVSIVGLESIASWGYPKVKLETERIVRDSGLPWTILRATQFYDYIFDGSRKLARFPVVVPVPAGFRVQPVDPGEVAVRLADLALGEPAGRVADMAGPQESSWAQLLSSYLHATGRHRVLLPVRIPGTRAVRDGGLLPRPDHTPGSRTWDQFLAARQQGTRATTNG